MSAYSDYLTSLSLPLWLRLGESSGTTAVNAGTLGATLNASIVNAPTLGVTGAIAGDADTAFTFAAASSQRVQIPHNAAIAGTTVTFGCWFRKNGAPAATQILMRKTDGGAFNYVMFLRNDGALISGCQAGGANKLWPPGGVSPLPAVVCDDQWHLGVCVIAEDVKQYIDGVMVGARSLDGQTVNTGTGNVHLASDGSTSFLGGSIDEPFVTLAALDARTIWNMYTLGLAAGRRPHPRLDARTRMRRFSFGFGK